MLVFQVAKLTTLAFWLMVQWLRVSGMTGAEDTKPINDGRAPATVVPSSRIVTTRKGSVRGLLVSWEDNQVSSVEMFLGVPYASPPIGMLRFMPPVTVSSWRTLRVVDRYSPVCPQQFPDTRNETEALKRMPRGRLETLRKLEPLLRNQSEDCLYLNIFAPFSSAFTSSSSIRPRYPVIVFIHGESYSWGSGNLYDGSVLAALGKVIVVTLNYRLGILGFLNPHNDPYSRSIANHGLMDQIAALHWLQENVAEFGGDPASVTLMGHGTGAACATFLMTSPAVPNGLFQRAVLLSGSSLSPWALIQEPQRYASELGRRLNCSASEEQATMLLKCLREKSVSMLTDAKLENPEFLHVFGPSVDNVIIEDEYGFDTKKMSDRLSRYDLLFGVTQSDSFFSLTAEDNQYGIEPARRTRLLRAYVRNSYQFHLQEILATIVNEYTDWEKTVLHPINIRDETLEALSDAQYVAPLVRTADLHGDQRHLSFFYVFEYQTKVSDFPQRMGCVHGEELAYIFGAPFAAMQTHFGHNYTKAEGVLSEMVITYWSNFARSGNPNEATYSNAEIKNDRTKPKVEWPTYDKQHRRYLSLGLKPKAKGHYRSHKLALWLNLIPDLHRPTADEVARHHHLFDDYSDPFSYNGKVRVVSATLATAPTTTPSPMTSAINSSHLFDSSIHAVKSSGVHPSHMGENQRKVNDLYSRNGEDHYRVYSTALSVTITIGCSLLILNVLIFAGVYYQRDKHRMELKRRTENGMLPVSISGEMEGRCQRPPLEVCRKVSISDAQSLQQQKGATNSGTEVRQNIFYDGMTRSSAITMTLPFGSAFTQLPPPDFADLPNHQSTPLQPKGNLVSSTLPRSVIVTRPSGRCASTLTRKPEQIALRSLAAPYQAAALKTPLENAPNAARVSNGSTASEITTAELRV